MDVLINFLLDNYIYFVFVAILLVLALVGYIVDTAKTEKLKKEYSKKEEETIDIPIANLGSNVKIGETVNKMATNSNANVKSSVGTISTATPQDAPKIDIKK